MTNETKFLARFYTAKEMELKEIQQNEGEETYIRTYFDLKHGDFLLTTGFISGDKTIDFIIESCKNKEEVTYEVLEESRIPSIKFKHLIKGVFKSFYFDAALRVYEIEFEGELLSTEIEQIEKEQKDDGLSNR